MTNRIMKQITESQGSSKGFTLMEMILVIVILGIMSVGISGFITLSTQTYLNATSRDELIGNARFVIERLSRELRDVVPNSVRVGHFNAPIGQSYCIQFTPIIASTVYLDIPVLPEPASKVISVIPFADNEGEAYDCPAGCNDLVTVYPLTSDDILFDSHTDATGKTFVVESVDDTVDPWQINLLNAQDVNFSEDSPTKRLYITRNQVSYCTVNKATGTFIVRFEENISSGYQALPSSQEYFMAGYVNRNLSNPFEYFPATLQRNAVVQIHLPFTNNGENYVFDHEVHINNVP